MFVHRRQLPLAIGIGLTVFALLRFFVSFAASDDEDLRFRSLVRHTAWAQRLQSWGFSGLNRWIANRMGFNPIHRLQARGEHERLELESTGYLVDFAVFLPGVELQSGQPMRQWDEVRRERKLWSDRVTHHNRELSIGCRRADLPRWREALARPLPQPIDYASLVDFARGDKAVPCRLPDGSEVALDRACRWLNERIQAGAAVSVVRESQPSGKSVVLFYAR